MSARYRLIALASVGVVLVGGVLAYREFWLARPAGSGPAGPIVESGPFQGKWTDRPVKLLGIGDSITAGLGARTAERGFFRRLVTNPADDFADMQGLCLSSVLPNLEVANLAVSGSNSVYHLEIIEEDILEHDSSVLGLIVLTTGGNDLIHFYGRAPPRDGAMYGATLEQARPWIAAFEKRLKRMLDVLNERFPGGCYVFLADIYDPTDGVGDALSVSLPTWPDGLKIHREYNRVIHHCAAQRNNVFLVELHAAFLGHGSHCRQFWRTHYRRQAPFYWYWENIEDPNDRGHDAIRRLYLNAIARVFAASADSN